MAAARHIAPARGPRRSPRVESLLLPTAAAIAVADIDGDGHADIVTAPTSGVPFVKVFSGADGTLLRAFLAGGSDKAIIAIAASRAIIAIAIGPEIRVVDTATPATRAFFSPFGGAAIQAVAIA